MRVTIEDATGKKVVIDDSAARTAEPWDGVSIAGRLIKADPERRFTLHVAYPCDRADRVTAADGHKDFASKDTVELGAHAYMLKHRKIGVGHEDGTEGSGDLVESGIHRGPDWIIKAADGSECVVKDGDWFIGVIWQPGIWEAWKSGRMGGVSMQGTAIRRKPSKDALARLRD